MQHDRMARVLLLLELLWAPTVLWACWQPVYRNVTYTQFAIRTVPYIKTNWRGLRRTHFRDEPFVDAKVVSAPTGQLECCAGHVMSANRCIPFCSDGCPANSQCTKPDSCECNNNYNATTTAEGKLHCQPWCPDDCPEGQKCVAPGECACPAGFKFSDDNCVPDCKYGCPPYSSCVAPNECKCFEGLDRDEKTNLCLPLCAEGCPLHSHCDSSGHCICEAGYASSIDDFCAPICEPACPGTAYCSSPGECTCRSGYQLAGETNKSRDCLPVCSSGCPAYSTCQAPEICVCNIGYEMNEPCTQCDPICEQGCPLRSVCFQPGTCLCEEGFILNAEGACEPEQPKCSGGCVNGFCFAPNECICNPGYLMGSNGTCEPVCSMGCHNGDCVEPEICLCRPGFQLTAHSVSVCEPVCEPACINANCAAPNVCLCWDQHQPSAGADHRCMPEFATSAHDTAKDMESCPSECRCWGAVDRSGTCLAPCSSHADDSCIQVDECHCIIENQELLCIAEDSGLLEKRLQCWQTRSLAESERQEATSAASNSGTGHWPLVSGIVAGLQLVSALAFVLPTKGRHREPRYMGSQI